MPNDSQPPDRAGEGLFPHPLGRAEGPARATDGRLAVAAPEVEPPRRILVVDDSRMQRQILSALLKRWGYRVLEAASGEEALALCRREPVDVVLSDWVMPGMSGLEFCRAFRALGQESYGYFILLTSKSEKAEVALGLEAGADDFLTKPVNSGELHARILAGERILRMQRELSRNNRLLNATLEEMRALYDALDRDLAEARKLQQSLMRERFRSFGTAEISLLLRPSGHVGGDLVGFFPIGPDRVGFFSIDVAGHGVTSALMTARLSSLLSGSSSDQNIVLRRGADGRLAARPPVEVAAQLNRLFADEIQAEHYFTLAYAEADLATGRVVLVQAGHPHPAVLRASGRVEFLGDGGLPVGLIPGAGWEEVAVQLTPGDRLLLLTDGITECPGADGAELGEAGLALILRRNRILTARAFLEALMWDLSAHAGKRDFPDDISGVLFEYQGSEAGSGIPLR